MINTQDDPPCRRPLQSARDRHRCAGRKVRIRTARSSCRERIADRDARRPWHQSQRRDPARTQPGRWLDRSPRSAFSGLNPKALPGLKGGTRSGHPRSRRKGSRASVSLDTTSLSGDGEYDFRIVPIKNQKCHHIDPRSQPSRRQHASWRLDDQSRIGVARPSDASQRTRTTLAQVSRRSASRPGPRAAPGGASAAR